MENCKILRYLCANKKKGVQTRIAGQDNMHEIRVTGIGVGSEAVSTLLAPVSGIRGMM